MVLVQLKSSDYNRSNIIPSFLLTPAPHPANQLPGSGLSKLQRFDSQGIDLQSKSVKVEKFLVK